MKKKNPSQSPEISFSTSPQTFQALAQKKMSNEFQEEDFRQNNDYNEGNNNNNFNQNDYHDNDNYDNSHSNTQGMNGQNYAGSSAPSMNYEHDNGGSYANNNNSNNYNNPNANMGNSAQADAGLSSKLKSRMDDLIHLETSNKKGSWPRNKVLIEVLPKFSFLFILAAFVAVYAITILIGAFTAPREVYTTQQLFYSGNASSIYVTPISFF